MRFAIAAIIPLLFITIILTATEPDAPTVQSQPEKAIIDVVFVIDTTGSMGGLIAGAKEKVWSIANTLATANPTPEIRMGLVAYRDRHDAYVTQVTDLTDDLDKAYATLMGFEANGGGDTPESVNQGLNEAVSKLSWSPDKAAYKVIFLVGDCPPHMDYQDDVKYPVSCEHAVSQGIIINTIQCGNHVATTPIWKEIAQLGGGAFSQVHQNGGATQISTQYDDEIAKLTVELEETRLYYGDKGTQQLNEDRLRRSEELGAIASPSAVADRTAYNLSKAGAKNFFGSKELLNDIANGTVHVKDIKDEHLPSILKGKSDEEISVYLEGQIKRRAELTKQLIHLQTQRRDEVATQREQLKAEGKGDSFDQKMLEIIPDQASTKGIEFDL